MFASDFEIGCLYEQPARQPTTNAGATQTATFMATMVSSCSSCIDCVVANMNLLQYAFVGHPSLRPGVHHLVALPPGPSCHGVNT